MFKEKPILYLKSSNEIKKVFSLFDDFNQNINNEVHKKGLLTYNALIITKDKKLLLCNRALSFYATYILTELSILNKILNLNYQKIKNSIYNLNVNEFWTLYYLLYINDIIDIKSTLPYYTKIVRYISKNFLKEFTIIKFDLIKTNIILTSIFKDILLDLKFNNFVLPNYKCIILPGGKKKYENENPIKILKRELIEELNIDINNVEFLDKFYNFQSLNNNPHPVLIMYVYDKILKNIYLDFTYILKINKTFSEIYENFKINKEINNVISSTQINFNTRKLTLSNIIYLLKIYKKYIIN